MSDEKLRKLERQAQSGDIAAQQQLDREKTRCSMENKVYIVTEIEWQYNDEYYYTSEHEGGKAIEAYRDLSEAVAVCEANNIAEARKLNRRGHQWNTTLGEYIGDSTPRISSDLAERMGLDLEDIWEYEIPEDATDADVLALLKAAKIAFYKVEAVNFRG